MKSNKKKFFFKFIFAFLIHFGLSTPSVFAVNLKTITLEWEEIPGAQKYEIEIVQTASSRSKVYNTNQTKWSGKLERGAYTYRIRALDHREVPGPWSEFESLLLQLPAPKLLSPEDKLEVLSEKSDTQEIEFKWLPIVEAHHYVLEVDSLCGANKIQKETQAAEITISLPSACSYSWGVIVYMDEKNEGSKAKSSRQFTIVGGPTEKVVIQEPSTSSDDKIKWASINGAKYGVSLFKLSNGDQWKKVEQKETLTAEYSMPTDLESGVYQIAVVAQAPNRKISTPSQLIFEHGHSAIETKSESLLANMDLKMLKPQSKTILAQYSLVQMQMKGAYNSFYSSSSPFFGSRFSLEGLFTSQKEKIDYFTGISTLIFKTDGKFGNTMDLRGGVKYSFRDNIKFLSGLFIKDVPQRYNMNNQIEITQLGYMGISFGAQYLFTRSENWNYMAHISFEPNLVTLSTPNGQKKDGGDAGSGFKFGVQASKFYKNKYMIYAGYLLIEENAKYPMDASSFYSATGSNYSELTAQTFSVGTSFRF